MEYNYKNNGNNNFNNNSNNLNTFRGGPNYYDQNNPYQNRKNF